MIVLDEQQVAALEFIKNFVHSDKHVATITGKAGTGKTTLIKYIIDYLNNNFNSYTLVAPTNKAALVLENKTGIEVTTLHSLLGLRPDYDIEKFNAKDLKFKVDKLNSLFSKIIICDEGSMVNDFLYDTLYKFCEERNMKIIYILDDAQLAPVKNEDKSKTTMCKNTFALKKIYRQKKDNPNNKLIADLRTKNITNFHPYQNEDLEIFDKRSSFLDAYVRLIREDVDNMLNNNRKIICFRNVMVDVYNTYCHDKLFQSPNFAVGEQIIFSENGYRKQYVNGDDGVIIGIYPDFIEIPEIGAYPGYYISVRLKNNEVIDLCVLSKDIKTDTIERIGDQIEKIRMKAVKAKPSVKKDAWKRFFKIVNGFSCFRDIITSAGSVVKATTFKYGYAITAHKSQGSEYKDVFIDVDDLNNCRDIEISRQLKYVAVSRTSNKIFAYNT